jgi:hypothetical protein
VIISEIVSRTKNTRQVLILAPRRRSAGQGLQLGKLTSSFFGLSERTSMSRSEISVHFHLAH